MIKLRDIVNFTQEFSLRGDGHGCKEVRAATVSCHRRDESPSSHYTDDWNDSTYPPEGNESEGGRGSRLEWVAGRSVDVDVCSFTVGPVSGWVGGVGGWASEWVTIEVGRQDGRWIAEY